MWSIILKSVMLRRVCRGCRCGADARFEHPRSQIPFPFMSTPVVHARADRVERDASVVFIRGEKNNRAAAVALTMPASGHDPKGNIPALTFTRYENRYRPLTIWESGSTGEDLLPSLGKHSVDRASNTIEATTIATR